MKTQKLATTDGRVWGGVIGAAALFMAITLTTQVGGCGGDEETTGKGGTTGTAGTTGSQGGTTGTAGTTGSQGGTTGTAGTTGSHGGTTGTAGTTGSQGGTTGTAGTGGGAAGTTGAGGAGGKGGAGGAAGGAGGGSGGGTGGAVAFAPIATLLGTSCGTANCHDGATPHTDLRNNAGLHGRLVGKMPPSNVTDAECKTQTLVVASNPTMSLLSNVVKAPAAARMNCAVRMPDDCSTTSANPRRCLTDAQIAMIRRLDLRRRPDVIASVASPLRERPARKFWVEARCKVTLSRPRERVGRGQALRDARPRGRGPSP